MKASKPEGGNVQKGQRKRRLPVQGTLGEGQTAKSLSVQAENATFLESKDAFHGRESGSSHVTATVSCPPEQRDNRKALQEKGRIPLQGCEAGKRLETAPDEE